MLPIYTFKSIWVQCAPLTSVASGLRLLFEATLVGYEPDTMGYRLWDNHTLLSLSSKVLGCDLRREHFQVPAGRRVTPCTCVSCTSQRASPLFTVQHSLRLTRQLCHPYFTHALLWGVSNHYIVPKSQCLKLRNQMYYLTPFFPNSPPLHSRATSYCTPHLATTL